MFTDTWWQDIPPPADTDVCTSILEAYDYLLTEPLDAQHTLIDTTTVSPLPYPVDPPALLECRSLTTAAIASYVDAPSLSYDERLASILSAPVDLEPTNLTASVIQDALGCPPKLFPTPCLRSACTTNNTITHNTVIYNTLNSAKDIFPNLKVDQRLRRLTLDSPDISDLLAEIGPTAVVCYISERRIPGRSQTGLRIISYGIDIQRFYSTKALNQVRTGLFTLTHCIDSIQTLRLPKLSSVYIVGVIDSVIETLSTGRCKFSRVAPTDDLRQSMIECGHHITLVSCVNRHKIGGCRDVHQALREVYR